MLQSKPQILIHQLNYAIPNDKLIFNALDLTLTAKKIGLIGRNGTGKSTLLKLIVGELLPNKGTILITGTTAYCPQQVIDDEQTTIAQILGVEAKLNALTRIEAGSIDEHDFKIIGDDWLIEERTKQQLSEFGLTHLKLSSLINTLSGGEKTRLHLAKAFLANPDFIILDEPTNNLDISSREYLYDALIQWKKGLLIVSHDRTLLNLMDEIIELTTLGLHIYGGNYDQYVMQKELQRNANQRELNDAKKLLALTHSSIQNSRETREQKQSRGRKLRRTGKIDKMGANSKKGRSEKTQSRLVTQGEQLLKNAYNKLQEASAKIENVEEIKLDLSKTFVPNGKVVAEIENLSFQYANEPPLINQFNLKIIGPERIAFVGKNGSGKTTLIKLLLGDLIPNTGKITLGIKQISYLDQNATILNANLPVLENFLNLNSEASTNEAHHALAQFLFRNVNANKLVHQLSGGEKLRAALACTLLATKPPQLLILDEPTNHLDLQSIATIESALSCYQGAVIVITHDLSFLKNTNITKFIYAPYRT